MSLFLKLFERIYSPLTAGLLKPCRTDAKLQDHKRTHLEKLCGQNVRVNDIQRSGLGLESVRSEGFFCELAELRWMQSGTKTKVLAKTRYQRPPLFWIDTIGLTGNHK